MKDLYGVLAAIKSVTAECESKGCEAEWFLFGSFLDHNMVSDIDLLVIAPEGGCMEFIRVEVEKVLPTFPVELTIMSQAEEEELNFLAVTRARSIADICDE